MPTPRPPGCQAARPPSPDWTCGPLGRPPVRAPAHWPVYPLTGRPRARRSGRPPACPLRPWAPPEAGFLSARPPIRRCHRRAPRPRSARRDDGASRRSRRHDGDPAPKKPCCGSLVPLLVHLDTLVLAAAYRPCLKGGVAAMFAGISVSSRRFGRGDEHPPGTGGGKYSSPSRRAPSPPRSMLRFGDRERRRGRLAG